MPGTGIVYPPHSFAMYPSARLQTSVVRFTAPADGKYDVSALWSVGDAADDGTPGNTVLTHIYKGDRQIFVGDVDVTKDVHDTARFKGTVDLKKGEALYFVLDPNGAYSYDVTLADLVINGPQ